VNNEYFETAGDFDLCITDLRQLQSTLKFQPPNIQPSFIITTNKNPKEWAHLLNDEALAAALLDRLLYHSEVIKLTRKSYRLENRKTIFNQTKS